MANIIMDTTCFGRSFGVTALMSSLDGLIVHTRYVTHETAALYCQGLLAVIDKGMDIQSIAADGFKGIAALFPDDSFPNVSVSPATNHPALPDRTPQTGGGQALKQIADSILRQTNKRLPMHSGNGLSGIKTT